MTATISKQQLYVSTGPITCWLHYATYVGTCNSLYTYPMCFVKLCMWLLMYSTNFLCLMPQMCTFISCTLFHCSVPICLAVVIVQIDPPLTRTISEGEYTDVCVSKDIGSVRAVNFSLTLMDGSAGGVLKYVYLFQCLYVFCLLCMCAYMCIYIIYYERHV